MVSATLAIFAAACGTSSSPVAGATPTPACSGSGSLHAYVVVQHLNGSTLQRCVAYSGTINGKQLMDQSGISYQTQTFSFGLGVCSIDNEPATFTQCFPQGQPYWSLFVEHAGAWTQSQTGFDQVNLQDKDALGWRYVPAADMTPSPPPLAHES
jgi:hypothetical protein